MSTEQYFETKKYRCLVEYPPAPPVPPLYLVMCGLEHCAPDKSFGPIKRSGYHLHVILSGEGTVEVGGKNIRLHTGQMFMEKPGEITRYFPDPENPWAYCWVTFDGPRADFYAEQAGFKPSVNTRNCYVDTREFYKLAEQLLEKTSLSLPGRLRRFGLMHQFVALAVESHQRGNDERGRGGLPILPTTISITPSISSATTIRPSRSPILPSTSAWIAATLRTCSKSTWAFRPRTTCSACAWR